MWATITMDHWVLEIIQMGYAIPFTYPPSLSIFRDASQKHLLREEVDHLLQLGAMEQVLTQHRGKEFYSHYFLTQKKNRG